MRAVVDQEIGQIAPKVVLYELTTDPPGATVYVDRKELGARAPR
ncbi:MAG: hypothetical protein R3F59_19480 [Myxococcota bacterium]